MTTCPVLHQDDRIIAVNKPCGVLAHPNPGRAATDGSAFEGTYDMTEECFTSPAGKVWLLHRIDQDTSGIMLGALDAATAERCRAAFEQGTVQKTYLAVVSGIPPNRGVWKDHLIVSKDGPRVRTKVKKSAPPNSELRYRLVSTDYRSRLSLLEIQLITGRTHQIRVQAAERHLPVAGDDVYGDFALNRKFKTEVGLRRLFLHAASVELTHPATGKPLRIEAPLPPELMDVLRCAGLSRRGKPPGK